MQINFGKTLNLPQTGFKMKANLPEKEKEYLRQWQENKIYEKSIENKDSKVFSYMMDHHMQMEDFMLDMH